MNEASSTRIERSRGLLDALESAIENFIKERDIPLTEVDWSEPKEDRPDREVRAGYLTLALAGIDGARDALEDNNVEQAVEQSLRAGVFAGGVLDAASRQRLYSQYAGSQTKHKAFWEYIAPIVERQCSTEQTDSAMADYVVGRWNGEHPITDLPALDTIRKRIGRMRRTKKN